MKVTLRCYWDDEAKVWCAVADGDTGICTEASSLDTLWRKLPGLTCDFLERDDVEIEMVVTGVNLN